MDKVIVKKISINTKRTPGDPFKDGMPADRPPERWTLSEMIAWVKTPGRMYGDRNQSEAKTVGELNRMIKADLRTEQKKTKPSLETRARIRTLQGIDLVVVGRLQKLLKTKYPIDQL